MFPGMYKSNSALQLQSQPPHVCDDDTHCYSTLLLAHLFAMITQQLNVRNHVGCVSCHRVVQAYMQEKEDAGVTVVLLSMSGGLVAAFAILDCVASQLSDHSNWCDAGDNMRTAHLVAAGIKHVMAELLPSGKAEQVKGLA